MTERNKWKWGLFGLGAAAIIGLSSTTLYASVYAQTETAQTETRDETPFTAVSRQEKFFALGGDHRALLAQALDISEAELEAAMTEVHNAALDQAVEDGKITQEQADQVKAGELGERWRSAHPGLMGRRMMGVGPMALGPLSFGWRDAGDEHEEALAAALGITMEELQAAKAEVPALLLADAVAAGKITQEEADLISARMALRDYMQEIEQSAYEDGVAEAVAAGVITQEQADQLLSEGDGSFLGWGRFGRGSFGPRLGGGHRGWHHDWHRGGRFGGPKNGLHEDWFSLPGGDQSPESELPENSSAPRFELPVITL